MDALAKRDTALHGLLFLAALGATALAPPTQWPWYLLLPLLVYAGIVLAVPRLRRTAPRLALGPLGGTPLLAAIAFAFLTVGVLLGFQALARPDVTALAARLPVAPFGNVMVAGLCFSVVNAVLEELVFRGVLWEVVAGEWGKRAALVVTSILFGFGHLDGYPPGPLGAVLAGLFGAALGFLRWWTNGLGLAVACHIAADATIFWILFQAGAFERNIW